MALTEIVVFNAQDGDCILVRCLEPEFYSILIDGGRRGTEAHLERYMTKLPPEQQQIDLFIVTHVDSDHLAGSISIVESSFLGERIKEVWFNGPTADRPTNTVHDLSFKEGIDFIEALRARKIECNLFFPEGSVERRSADIPCFNPKPKLRINVLAPTAASLVRLRSKWSAAIQDLKNTTGSVFELDGGTLDVPGLAAQRYVKDNSAMNASSIITLIENEEHSLLMTADAPCEALLDALPTRPARCDVCKFPHHGSGSNYGPDLARALDARAWIVSANGRHGHPEGSSIARMLSEHRARGGSETAILFNNSPWEARLWSNADVESSYGYHPLFRGDDEEWFIIRLDGKKMLFENAGALR